ncbi:MULTISPECIES: RHS repeat-associated core domain-containing protein [Burkholderia]|uniref:RHS repeat-associated core domain-containing protein n=1 Tax=Burkholderia TaxID=32008 RepID=UPI0009C0FB62|nr:RHS repeat-associated core domain-containing protein [Burkholderia cepacia]MCA7977680.1 hypothetical protein [Burkholderia cepacia]MCA8116535.1 hypothetical protein [Burkholderia cepacia]MCA8401957.1 hypothetical protein [Burkholderia cepacia]NTX19505.1 hypothetical protein [Burkholderia cepacia]
MRWPRQRPLVRLQPASVLCPGTGRLISKDPIGLAEGLNAFQYAPNPAGWIDPLGLAKTTCDLYAFGNASGPREPRIQGVNTKSGQNADLIADAVGMVGPTTEGGASTFGDINKAPITSFQLDRNSQTG